jgi:hypothetical protein
MSKVTPAANNKDEEKIKAVYDIARKRFEDEREMTKRLDEYARSLVSSILVVIGFLLAAGTISMVEIESVSSRFYFIGIGSLVTSVFVLYFAFRNKAASVPQILFWPKRISKDSRTSVEAACIKTFNEIYKDVAAATLESVFHNNKKNLKKGTYISLTWTLMLIGLVMVTAFVAMSIAGGFDNTERNENATSTLVGGMLLNSNVSTNIVAVLNLN